MSVSAVSAVLENSKSKGLARLVFVCIAQRMKSNGQARCSLTDIAKRAALFSNNIPRLIRELEGLGELIVLKKGDSEKSTLYQISASIMVILPGSIKVIRKQYHGNTGKRSLPVSSPPPITSASSLPLFPDTPPLPPLEGGNGSSLFSELKPQRKTKNSKETEPSEEFLDFWEEYPRKVAQKAAWKAWQKSNPPISLVLESLSEHKKSPQWRQGKEHIPYPATWINGERWDDEL